MDTTNLFQPIVIHLFLTQSASVLFLQSAVEDRHLCSRSLKSIFIKELGIIIKKKTWDTGGESGHQPCSQKCLGGSVLEGGDPGPAGGFQSLQPAGHMA